jgi:hypothetical protein
MVTVHRNTKGQQVIRFSHDSRSDETPIGVKYSKTERAIQRARAAKLRKTGMAAGAPRKLS